MSNNEVNLTHRGVGAPYSPLLGDEVILTEGSGNEFVHERTYVSIRSGDYFDGEIRGQVYARGEIGEVFVLVSWRLIIALCFQPIFLAKTPMPQTTLLSCLPCCRMMKATILALLQRR